MSASRRGAITSALVVAFAGVVAGPLASGEELDLSGVQEPLRGVPRCELGTKCIPRCEWPISRCDPDPPGRTGLSSTGYGTGAGATLRTPGPAERSAVIITAWGRSGTTFLGEILQRNRDFLYLYEPVRPQFRAHFGPMLARNGERSAAFLSRLIDCLPSRRDRVLLFKDKAGLARGGLCDLSPSEVERVCGCKHMAIKTIRINGELDHLIAALGGANATRRSIDGWEQQDVLRGAERRGLALAAQSGSQMRVAVARSRAAAINSNEGRCRLSRGCGPARIGARALQADNGLAGDFSRAWAKRARDAELIVPDGRSDRAASRVHIVHLIRDPRAILASWQSLPGFTEFRPRSTGRTAYKTAGELCHHALQDRAAGLRLEEAHARRARARAAGAADDSDGTSGEARPVREVRYTLLRYEDLALAPVATARQLYAQLGLELQPALLRWINESTHATSAALHAARANALNGLDATHDRHATVRNAANVVGKWRRMLSPLHIVAATAACKEMLTTLGYETDLAQLVPEEYRTLEYPFARDPRGDAFRRRQGTLSVGGRL